MNESSDGPNDRGLVTLLSTSVALPAYLFMVLLARFSPDPPPMRTMSANVYPPVTGRYRRSARCVGLFLSAYERSLVHRYLYRGGSPCRFIPSCADYPVRAVEKYGLWRGLWLAGARLRRCKPEYDGDYVDFP